MSVPVPPNNKKTKQYFLQDDLKVYFNSDFDGGNLEKVEQLAPYIYKIYPSYDKNRQSTNKTFFHFKVYGFKMCAVRFHIVRVHILEKLLKKNQGDIYRPIYRRGNQQYKRFQEPVELYMNKFDEIQVCFTFQFGAETQWHQFAFAYPYSYQRCYNLVKDLKEQYQNHDQIYFHEEVLGYTTQKREIQLITISDKVNCEDEREEKIDGLFPLNQDRPYRINKPKIIVSARVHPGQAPASYCLQGFLRFLLNAKDYRSHILRRNFHFIIVPMLNPDGVYNGYFRTDIHGDNLNRHYQNCTKNKHPTIWYFRKYLLELNARQETVAFYFDFHAHPSKKEFFIYGNAFNEFTQQVEAETFGKILEDNCPFFHNVDSIFHEKQMKAKDKLDTYSKEGCARVYIHRLFNLIHSYTVQCGYFTPGKLKKLSEIQTNAALSTHHYQYTSEWQQCNPQFYTPESYMLMGKSILICILDLFHLNPYSRINNNSFKSISNMRKAVSVQIFANTERFRMIDGLVNKKMKDLTELIQQNYYRPRFEDFGLSVSQNHNVKFKRKAQSMNAKVYMPRNSQNFRIKEIKKQISEHQKDQIKDLLFHHKEIIQEFVLNYETEAIPDSARTIVSSNSKVDLQHMMPSQPTRYKSSEKSFLNPKNTRSQINDLKSPGTIKTLELIQRTDQRESIHRSRSMRISLFLKKSIPKQIPRQKISINKVQKKILAQMAKQKNIMAISGSKNFIFPNLKNQNK